MPQPYSLDLKQKAIAFLQKGNSKRHTARQFGIGEDTLYRWLRLAKTGDLKAKKRTDFPRKVPDHVLRAYVEQHPDHTLKEIGQAVGLHSSKVGKHLTRMNITRKKRPCFISSDAKRLVRSSKPM